MTTINCAVMDAIRERGLGSSRSHSVVLNLGVALTRRELAKASRGQHPSQRVRIAQVLIWSGRAYLVTLLLVYVGSWLARPAWISAPRPAGTPAHWIADTAVFFLLVFAMLWPLLLLPVTSIALTTSERGWLYGVSVLGRRRVAADSLRAARVTLPGRGYSSYAAALRDGRLRLLIVIGTGMWQSNHFDEIAGRSIPDPPHRRRALTRYLAGLAVIVASVLIGLTMMAILGYLLGLWVISAD